MPEWGVALVAVACAVGVAGTVVPILPGTLVVGGAIALWGLVEGPWPAWAVTTIALAVLAAGALLKYLIPGRRLASAGVPTTTLVIGGVGGIIGFFVIPVVGILVGFVAGVFLTELVRQRDWRTAWPATWAAMKAWGLSTLIEMAAALLATTVWAAGVALT